MQTILKPIEQDWPVWTELFDRLEEDGIRGFYILFVFKLVVPIHPLPGHMIEWYKKVHLRITHVCVVIGFCELWTGFPYFDEISTSLITGLQILTRPLL